MAKYYTESGKCRSVSMHENPTDAARALIASSEPSNLGPCVTVSETGFNKAPNNIFFHTETLLDPCAQIPQEAQETDKPDEGVPEIHA